MKFFVPGATDERTAERLYQTWAQVCQALPGQDRLFRIVARWAEQEQTYEVGKDLPNLPGSPVIGLYQVGENSYVAVASGRGAGRYFDCGPFSIGGTILETEYFELPDQG